MTSSVQFLFATMNGALFERNPEVLARAENYLIIDQHPGPDPIQPGPRQHTISVRDSGLSKSRNLALDHATADICYLCDDDIALAPDAPELVRDAFGRNPEADILIFARGTSFPSEDSPSAESSPRLGINFPGPFRKALSTALPTLLSNVLHAGLPTGLRLLGTSSIQIAFRRESILAKSIRFDEQFGLGEKFPTSEEALFLHDCVRAGLKIKWVDTLVATHEMESSGARYANPDLAAAKGAMLSRLFGAKRRFAALAFAFKNYPLYRDHMNLFGFLEALERGARLYEQGSAVSHRPGQDESAPKPDSLALFAALHHANIRYAAWKDLHELEAFHRGNAEIDLLVHPEDAEAFEQICAEQHFAQFINRPDVYAGAISHFIRFAHGGYSHLHVHRALLTGDHTAKEYDFTPLVECGFFQGPIRNEIRVLEDHVELAIGMIRLILKAKNPHGIKMDELHRLRAVGGETKSKAAFDWIGSKVDLSSAARDSLTRLIAGDDDELQNIGRYEKEFSAFRRMSPARVHLNQLRVRLSNVLARRDALANKVMPTTAPANGNKKAPSVAIIGVDGSGKTTLCNSVQQILGAKISVKRIYLGSNSETYSLSSRLAYLASGVAGRLHLAWSKNAFLCDLKWFTRALLEYSKCRDRVAAIRRGERYARQGVFVLYERYPIKGLFDYPAIADEVERGEVELEGRLGAMTRSLLRRIDPLLDRVSPPDATLLIRTHFDQIAARRALAHGESEDIQRKLALLENFDGSNFPGFHEITNEGQAEETLETVLQWVNEQLCSRNS